MSDIGQLSRMARALRESRTGQHAHPNASRTVILTEAANKRRRRRIGVAWLVPLAAVLVISTAVAGVGPARRVAWKQYLERLVGGDRSAPIAAAANHAAVPAAPLAEPGLPEDGAPMLASDRAPAEVKEPTETNAAEIRPAAPRPARVAKVAKRAESQEATKPTASSDEPVNRPAPSAPAVQPDDDGLLYARAHEAHFVQRNASAALTAWDAYLAARPEGRFALEAKYNRALCLVRLARLDEAKAALEPFRDGRFGSYRQVEAKRLLDALSQRQSPSALR
jgi:hypothetical protein